MQCKMGVISGFISPAPLAIQSPTLVAPQCDGPLAARLLRSPVKDHLRLGCSAVSVTVIDAVMAFWIELRLIVMFKF